MPTALRDWINSERELIAKDGSSEAFKRGCLHVLDDLDQFLAWDCDTIEYTDPMTGDIPAQRTAPPAVGPETVWDSYR